MAQLTSSFLLPFIISRKTPFPTGSFLHILPTFAMKTPNIMFTLYLGYC